MPLAYLLIEATDITSRGRGGAADNGANQAASLIELALRLIITRLSTSLIARLPRSSDRETVLADRQNHLIEALEILKRHFCRHLDLRALVQRHVHDEPPIAAVDALR